MLCVSLKNATLADIEEANQKADLIELHLEQFNDFQLLKKARRACFCPVIFKLSQLIHLDWAKELAPEFIDYPHDAPLNFVKSLAVDCKRICSYHHFEKTPDNLEEILLELKRLPADFYKIATFATSLLDSLKMLLFVKKTGVLGLCMGELGTITRILAPVVGTPWMYASLKKGYESAPGQLTIDELLTTYHHHSLSSKSNLYGLIGNPISQSRSHQTHNFAFTNLNINGVYVKMQIQSFELKDFIKLAQELNFCGLSVTMPLKEAIVPYVHRLISDVGAINTLKFMNDEIWGWNTDGSGALSALEKKCSVSGKKIFLLGGGGAAKGFAVEASKRGAEIVIFNRTLARAKELAERVGGKAYSLDEFSKVTKEGYDILINASSVGMDGKSMPIEEKGILRNRIVMDMISNPEKTPLIIAAQKKQCQTITGMEMFIQQATDQYCIWFSEKIHG